MRISDWSSDVCSSDLLTDGQGRTVDFRNTVVVMTSNLGSNMIQEMMSKDSTTRSDYAAIKEAVMTVVGQHFRPEFINRIDEAVVFHPLGSAQIRSIARIQTQSLVRHLVERGIALSFSDAELDKLTETDFDPVYGARPLMRAIQALVASPLARRILDGHFPHGDTVVAELAAAARQAARACRRNIGS